MYQNSFKFFRNGGEEFSVVIRNYSLDQSVKLAENIRTGVEKSSFHLPNKEVIKLSVSIGVGYLSQDDHKSQRKVFKDADDMVHVAKNEGRNQVMFNQSLSYRNVKEVNILINQIINISGYLNMLTFLCNYT